MLKPYQLFVIIFTILLIFYMIICFRNFYNKGFTRKTYPEPEEPDADVPDTGHRAENQVQDQGSKHDVVQRKHLNIKSYTSTRNYR